MAFIIEDRHLIFHRCFRVSKGSGATNLLKMFLDNNRQTISYWGNEVFKFKKTDMTGSIKTDSGRVVIHAVHVHLPASKLMISHSAKKINHGNSSQWKIVWQISIFQCSDSTMINWRVLTFHQMSVFNCKSHNLQTWKYDVSMTSPVTKNIKLFHLWNT